MFTTLFTRRWIIATLLVIAAIAVMIRLGIWQLDRLEQRRQFNAHFLEQTESGPLRLESNTNNLDLVNMEYHQVIASGEFDHTEEVAIRNQYWENQPGVHLLTPLRLKENETAVLVDRGWIPLEAYQSGDWKSFEEPGIVSVSGIIRISQEPTLGGRSDPTPLPSESLMAWNFINIPEISKQIPYPLLPIYIQQSPGTSTGELPIRSQPEIEISEGPHLGYAIQWFIFAIILGGGYPWYIRQELSKQKKTPERSTTQV
jgi:surfeit locus 1 family protein